MVGMAAGCTTDQPPETSPDGTPPATDASALGFTHQRPTGNRLVDGAGRVPAADPVDVPLDGTPAWVVGVPAGDTSAWAAVTEDGAVTGVAVDDAGADRFGLPTGAVPPGAPPLMAGGDPPDLVGVGADDAAPLTHPVPVEGGHLYVAENGDLVLWDGAERDRVTLDAPTDARIVVDGSRAFVLADATGRYDHAVLGDGVEAGSVAVVDVGDGLAVERRIDVRGRAVVEGLSPLLADVTGAGRRAVLVTESGDGDGARLAAYRPDGTRVAASRALTAGWRHQLAVAPFGPDDTPELAAVRKPHVDHRLQFFRREGDELAVVAGASGYGSHTIGSRNLDGALAGDLDGDGSLEVLVPTTARDELAAVRRTGDGAEQVWSVPLDGRLTTNVGAVTADGRVTVAAGTASGVRFWRG
jgi:hypothetical protein